MPSLSVRSVFSQRALEERTRFSGELWVVSNLPPPVHGVSMFNQGLLAECGRRGIAVRFVRVGSESGGGIGRFSVSKVARECRSILQLFMGTVPSGRRARGRRVLYFTPSQWGPAVFRDAAISLMGRLLFDRVVGHIHGCGWLERRSRGGPFAYAMRYALGGCDEVVCLGETFAQGMRSSTGLRCTSVDNGANGVADGSAKVAPGSNATVELLFLGNFIRSKGFWAAAEAAEDLVRSGRSVRLRCAGEWRDSRDRAEFTTRFESLLASGALGIVGLADADAKEQLLRDSHFLLLPTRYPFEGQPLVLIEALSAGLIPITTDQGGIPDLMRFPGSEVLVSDKHASPQGVAESIRYLLENGDAYERLSAACLARYWSHLTLKRCADELLGVIEGERP